jgi:cytochrome bd-type quinol oxidase subunit 2
MEDHRESTRGSSYVALVALRWILVVALALAVVLHARLAVVEFTQVDGASRSYYVNLLIGLAPALLYALAVILVLAKRGGRTAWSILLACGLALSAVSLFYLLTVGYPELMPPQLCLVALAVVQLASCSPRMDEVHDGGQL